ncbi:PadR family transcriptional regulator [Natrinema sp. CGMCC1.2065]|uniref:PadR family transcriptional regulator n=1 Tax=Natrinema sp. CGMCC1.2065 TaxID=3445767 RepID=UPI003F49FE5E
MQDDTTRGLNNPATTAESTSETATSPSQSLTLCYETAGGTQRKIRFAPASGGEWYMAESEWNGCRYRENGFRRITDYGLEFSEIPEPITRAVLAELFETALEGDGVADLDVLNAIARETFGDDRLAEAKHRARRNRDDDDDGDREIVADGSATWGDLSAFQRDCLEAIARLKRDGETSYGLAIKRDLEDDRGEEVNHGRLYPNLNELAEFGFVEIVELDRRTNEYQLTDAGRRMLKHRVERRADALGLAVGEREEREVVADGGEE